MIGGKKFNDGSSITVLANGNVGRTEGGEGVLAMTLEKDIKFVSTYEFS